MVSVVEILVPGGKATPGPPLGPALGPLGVNIKKVVDEINEKTKQYNGMQVPVKVIVDEKKNISIETGTPPTSALIMQEAGIEKGSGKPNSELKGNITLEKAIKIAHMKKQDMLSYELKNAVKEVLGTCVTLGVTVEGKKPREVQQAIDKGEFDEIFKKEK